MIRTSSANVVHYGEVTCGEKSDNTCFRLALRLKTKPFQQHRLQTGLGRNIYHSCLGELYRRFYAMSGDGFFQETISLPKDHPRRGALLNERRRQYLISEYDLHA